MTNTTDLRVKSYKELIDELIILQKEQLDLRLRKRVNVSKENAPQSHNFKLIRRKVARIKTILNEKKNS
ncbi:MAG: 50S ribosomal protein L29 [Coxiellaceae bacterium]|jgi:ribosomal protein L29|nr:50S ribosomal protein L29 [Coxiellaceae bacterium]